MRLAQLVLALLAGLALAGAVDVIAQGAPPPLPCDTQLNILRGLVGDLRGQRDTLEVEKNGWRARAEVAEAKVKAAAKPEEGK